MKKIIQIFILSLTGIAFFLLTACEEETPEEVNYSYTSYFIDTTFVADNIVQAKQNKHYLIEEFTGVRCSNCPDGQKEIKSIMQGKDNISLIVHHSGNFAVPYPESNFDFRNNFSDNIVNENNVFAFPSIMIDRFYIPTDYDRVLYNKNQLGSNLAFIEGQSINDVPIGIYIEENPENSSDEVLKIAVQLLAFEDFASVEDLKLHIVLSESNLIDIQADNDLIVNDYQHDHIVRAMLTNWDGDNITSLKENTVWVKNYSVAISSWNKAQLNLIVFLSSGEEENYKILQSQSLSF